MGVRNPEDWYRVQLSDIIQTGGDRAIQKYGGKLHKSLEMAYPEHKWMPWLFETHSHGYLTHPDVQRKFLDWIGEKLDIKTQQQWYHVTYEAIYKEGGSLILDIYGSFHKALEAIYPGSVCVDEVNS